jgi:hypothetical protein
MSRIPIPGRAVARIGGQTNGLEDAFENGLSELVIFVERVSLVQRTMAISLRRKGVESALGQGGHGFSREVQASRRAGRKHNTLWPAGPATPRLLEVGCKISSRRNSTRGGSCGRVLLLRNGLQRSLLTERSLGAAAAMASVRVMESNALADVLFILNAVTFALELVLEPLKSVSAEVIWKLLCCVLEHMTLDLEHLTRQAKVVVCCCEGDTLEPGQDDMDNVGSRFGVDLDQAAEGTGRYDSNSGIDSGPCDDVRMGGCRCGRDRHRSLRTGRGAIAIERVSRDARQDTKARRVVWRNEAFNRGLRKSVPAVASPLGKSEE